MEREPRAFVVREDSHVDYRLEHPSKPAKGHRPVSKYIKMKAMLM